MSFKINDYNAFLTSLFDKTNNNNINNNNNNNNSNNNVSDAQQLQDQQFKSLTNEQRRFLQYANSNLNMNTNSTTGFPVDFDFGLIASANPGPYTNIPSKDDINVKAENSNSFDNKNSNNINTNNNTFILNQNQSQDSNIINDSSTNTTNTRASSDSSFLNNNDKKTTINNSSYTNNLAPSKLESTLSLPEQSFDYYNVNFHDSVNSNAKDDQLNTRVKMENIEEEENPIISNTYLGGPNADYNIDNSLPTSPLSSYKDDESTLVNAVPLTANFPQMSYIKSKTNNSPDFRLKSELITKLELFESSNSHIHHPHRPRIKSAHNVIEQRYRNKINDKFTALQNSVPTLRVVARRKQKSGSPNDQHHNDEDEDDYVYDYIPIDNDTNNNEADDLEGLEPAKKLNKGTILSKSIEYIKFLELKNNKIKQEHQELIEKARMLGLSIDEELLESFNN